MYARYIDDILLVVDDENELLTIKNKLTENSVLSFTHEHGHNKLAFLDVLLEMKDGNLQTSVYVKPTNSGEVLNYKSECSEKYKKGVITNLLHRGYQTSSNIEIFNQEINRLKQLLANNNYPMKLVDNCVNSFLQSKLSNERNNLDDKTKIKIYYKNQMNGQYKKDEKVIKDIIKQNVKPTNENEKIDVIYYKNLKTKNLIMKNNMTRTQDPLMTFWTVYKFKCPNEDCELLNPSYIGQTRNTIKTRLQQHCRDGAIKEHMQRKHNTGLNTEILENNTKPVKNFSKLNKLIIYEALLIIEERPDINRQIDNFTNPLKLYSRSPYANHHHPPASQTTQTQHQYNLRSQGRNM